MNETELNKRLKQFQQRLDFAQEAVGVPSLVIYAFMAHGDSSRPASVIGGETRCGSGMNDENAVEVSLIEAITLLGYVSGRLEVMKQEERRACRPLARS